MMSVRQITAVELHVPQCMICMNWSRFILKYFFYKTKGWVLYTQYTYVRLALVTNANK